MNETSSYGNTVMPFCGSFFLILVFPIFIVFYSLIMFIFKNEIHCEFKQKRNLHQTSTPINLSLSILTQKKKEDQNVFTHFLPFLSQRNNIESWKMYLYDSRHVIIVCCCCFFLAISPGW